MIIYYLLIFILALIGMRFQRFNDDYMSIKSTSAINGLFTLLVFSRHFRQYVVLGDNYINNLFIISDNYLNQLLVVSFLFYSGFGIMYSLMNKEGYIKKFPQKRFLPTYLRFVLCVALFIPTALLAKTIKNYSLTTILLAFTGWTSIGNSNWYMFVIFALYVLTFISFVFLDRKRLFVGLIVSTIASVGLMVALYFTRPSFWWNTLLCFNLGMWYAFFKSKIDSLMKKDVVYWIVTPITVAVFFVVWYLFLRTGIAFIFMPLALLFALSMVFVTMKVKIGNIVLTFLGAHTFTIYILQRIPMILLNDYIKNPYLLFIVCLILTLAFAVSFDYLYKAMESKIHNIPKNEVKNAR